MAQKMDAEGADKWKQSWLLAPVVFSISFIAGAFDANVENLIRGGPIWWLRPITEADVFASIWGTALAIHAAVAAIAPVLGYTLLSAASSKTERLAPAALVVSNSIEWKSYLASSIALLVGSLAAFALAPSLIGLVVGLLATIFVLARTSAIYAKGFDIVSDEERLHAETMDYLKRHIRFVAPADEASKLDGRRRRLNEGILSLASVDPEAPLQHLFLNNDGETGSLKSIDDLLISRLISEASRHGLVILRVLGQEVPQIVRARESIFAVQWAAVINPSDAVPVRPLGAVDDSSVAKLQDVLDAAVIYEPPPHLEPAKKASYLVTRHLWTVLLDALDRGDDRAFRYGVSSLAELTNHLLAVCESDEDLREASREWLTEIPSRIVRRLEGGQPEILIEFARFVRQQLVAMGAREDFRKEFRSYAWLLQELLGISARKDNGALQFALTATREIPVLCGSISADSYRELLRAVIEAFLRSSGAEMSRSRRQILDALGSLITHWAPTNLSHKGIVAVVLVGLRAASMFLASRDARYADLELDVDRFSSEMREREFNASEFVDVAAGSAVEDWGWDWWEVGQRDPGGAHWVTIGGWFDKATLIELSKRLFSLRRMDAPSLAVIERLQRSLDELVVENAPGRGQEFAELRTALAALHQSRKEVVTERVRTSPVDREKATKFVAGAVAEIEGAYLKYGHILLLGGAIVSSRSVASSFGSSILVPKEWFVPDGVADYSSHTIPPSNGASMLRFEAGKVLESIVRAAPEVSHGSLSEVADLVARDYAQPKKQTMVIGDEDLLFDLEIAADTIWGHERTDRKILFVPGVVSDEFANHIVVVVPEDSELSIVRTVSILDEGEVFAEGLTSPIGGSVSVSLYAPTEAKIVEWRDREGVGNREEWEDRLRSSLVFSVSWNFEVAIGQFVGEVFKVNL